MRNVLLLACAFLAAACSDPVPGRPALARKGRPAPEIKLQKLLNAPVQQLGGWEELRGKVVVLEFWATWCEPCAEYLPELNAMAARFRDKPVVFIHITDESEADVRAFLEHSKIDGWVAPEAGAEIFKAFRVFGRPHTVLVDRAGAVSDFPRGDLSAAAIMDLLAGPVPAAGEASAERSESGSLGEFSIARASGASGRAQYGPASLEASSMPLEYALEWLFGRVDRFDIKPSAVAEMGGSYDIKMRLPAARAAEKERFFLAGLRAALGLKVSRSEREAEVYVLKKDYGGPLNVKEIKEYSGADVSGAVLRVRGGDFSVLALRLKEILGETVADETGVKGNYEYSFEIDTRDPAVMDRNLQKQLGLRLKRQRRKISVVEVAGEGAS